MSFNRFAAVHGMQMNFPHHILSNSFSFHQTFSEIIYNWTLKTVPNLNNLYWKHIVSLTSKSLLNHYSKADILVNFHKIKHKFFQHIMSASKLLSVYFSVSLKWNLKTSALPTLFKRNEIFLLLCDPSQDCKGLAYITQVLLSSHKEK